MSSYCVSSQKVKTERVYKTVLQGLQHISLFLYNLSTAVGHACDVYKVPHYWDILLFIFTGYEHGCHTY